MKNHTRGGSRILPLLVLALPLVLPGGVKAQQAPDLVKLGQAGWSSYFSSSGQSPDYNYSLGPTGMRGWLYRDGSNVGDAGLMTAQYPWQILVVAVGASTPASGIMASNDVILGVSTGLNNLPVPLFTSDARKSIGWAIGDAEAGDGWMNLKRWRAGVTNDVSIHLYLSNLAYSATAPYNCPKSALILSNAINIIANESFGSGAPGDPVLGLALLATGNPAFLPKVQAYARSIAPANLAIIYAPGQDTSGAAAWDWGYKGVFLSEYYLATGDTNVLHGINEYAVALAQAQSMYGTMAHGGAQLNPDGSFHGSIGWYGPVNQGGLAANLAIVMGKKCLVASGMPVDPEIDPAIGRAANFFSYYVNKGGIPYGEHEPCVGAAWRGVLGGTHSSNGKDSLAAVLFAMMGDQPAATEYFTRMTVAGFNGREYGHTGQGFSYLWGAMAANIGGTNAAASYLAQLRWHLDLERRCDGSFVYDGGEQYGGSHTYNYWDTSQIYAGIDPTASYVLTFALPQHQLYLTGKNADTNNWLSSDEVTNAIWAGQFPLLCGSYGTNRMSTNQLFSALSEYDPVVRWYAADTLGTNTLTSYAMLTNLLSSTNASVRAAACQALGDKLNTSALALLGQRLSDTDVWVRSQASKALQNFGSAASSQLTTMLMAFTNNATDPHVIVWSDPVQIANGYLANELFNTLGASTIGANTNLLYPAVRLGLQQPDGMAQNYLSDFIQNRLSLAAVQAVGPSLVSAISHRSPADQMFSDAIRAAGLQTLAKYKIEEGIPLCLMYKEQTWAGDDWTPYTLLQNTYRGAAKEALPTLYAWQAHIPEFEADPSVAGCCPTRIQNIITLTASTIAAIQNDTAPPTLVYFKKMNSVSASPATVNLPAASTTVSVSESDQDNGVARFTWSKVRGAGNVSFTPNGVTNAACTVTFDTPGSYVLQVGAVDNSILYGGLWVTHNLSYYDFQTYTNNIGSVFTNITVTVGNDTNRAPVPQNQSLTTPLNTALAITLVAVDPNGDAMTYSVVTLPAHGTFSGTAPNLVYTPAGGYTGLDSFTFKANDGTLDSPVATVTIDVGTTGNRRPVAINQAATTAENTTKAITLAGTDPDNNPLTYLIVGSPVHGTVTGTPPNVSYVPAANYPAGNFNGTDSFTFAVKDASLTSAVATVSITVTPVNQPPVATPQTVNVSANTATAVTLAGVDPEGYALLYATASNPSHGTLSGTAPNLTYLPATNYHGADSFTFKVTDSEGAVSPAATISITVVTTPPVANSQYVEVSPNKSTAITLTGTDSSGLTLAYTVLTQPTNGTLTGTAPNVTYNPAANYVGADSFTFKVYDGVYYSTNNATVSIDVVQWQGWTNIAAGNWSVGTSWAGGAGPAAGGGTNYLLVFNTSGYSGTSQNDLSGTFQLNRVIFGSALPAVTISGNALSLTSQPATLTQVIQNSANTLTINNPLTLAANTTLNGSGAGAVTLAGVISGSGGLTQTYGGILTLGGGGVNTYSGGTTVSAGTLILNQNRFNLGSGTVTLANGTTFYTENFEGNTSAGAITNTLNLPGGFATTYADFGGSKDIWISGPIVGVGGLQLQGSGRSPGVMLSGAKTFSGGVTLSPLNGGTPMLGIDNLASLGTGTLRSELASSDIGSGNLRAYASLATAPGVTNAIDLAPGCRLVVDSQNYSLLLSGPITDSGSLIKIGSGTLTLSGNNTYSGSTTVSAGTLSCANSAALGSGALSIASGATLNLNFAGTVQVASLAIAGTSQPSGSYGSSSSPALTKSTQFTGTGTVTVGPLPSLTDAAATGLTTTGAALNSTLGCNGAGYRVVAFWNTVNGGTNPALWANSAYVGAWTNVASTNVTYTAAGLTPNSTYYFTFRATNALSTLWATNVQSLTTLTPPVPVVDNAGGATNLSVGVAQLRGTLANGPADARFYWGTTDGGVNQGSWANANLLPNAPNGALAANVSNLLYGLTYYYRGYASNANGTAWALATTNFTSLRPASSLANSPATGLATTSAALNGTLACTGAVYNVVAYWNTVNGGVNAALWTNSAYVGSWTNVASTNLSFTATGLAPSTAYFFTFLATNALDSLWATNVQGFTTLALLPAPELPVSGVTVTGGVPSFTFTAAAGVKYRLDYKNALTDPGWMQGDWSTNTSGSPQSMTLTDPSAVGQPQRFYRLEAAAP